MKRFLVVCLVTFVLCFGTSAFALLDDNSVHQDVDVEQNVNVDVETDVDIEITDVDVDITVQDQEQNQVQGQQQETTIIIEDEKQHTSQIGLMNGPDMLGVTSSDDFSTAIFLFPNKVTYTEAKGMAIRPGWLWFSRTVVHMVGPKGEKSNSIAMLEEDPGKAPIAIISVRGNSRTYGYEVVGQALMKAMDLGATKYEVIHDGVYKFGRSFGMTGGASGGYGTLGHANGILNITGSGGTSLGAGSSGMRVKPFITIVAY